MRHLPPGSKMYCPPNWKDPRSCIDALGSCYRSNLRRKGDRAAAAPGGESRVVRFGLFRQKKKKLAFFNWLASKFLKIY